MPVQALLGLSVLTSFVAFGIVAKLYIAPPLKAIPWEDALSYLIAPHMFRFVGLSFAPYYDNAWLGNNPFGSPLPQITDDAGTPFTVVVIPVDMNFAVKGRP